MNDNRPRNDAERAFHRLMRTFFPDGERQEDVLRAMSILGVTPRDPAWLSVVVGVDLIEELRRQGDADAGEVAAQIAIANEALLETAKQLSTARAGASVKADALLTAAAAITAAASEVKASAMASGPDAPAMSATTHHLRRTFSRT